MKKLLCCFALVVFLLPVCHAQTGVYRALCVANAHYDDGRVRLGGINSAQGMYDCLSRSFGGYGSFISSMSVDLTKSELMETILLTFRDAVEGDVSLFYINAHGGSQGGVYWIETREGGRVYPHELEQCLGAVPGYVIILIDACSSGGFIGNQSSFAENFSGAFGQNVFASDKFAVMTSCYSDENSYRVTADTAVEKSVSTVFARAFCEGLGWDLINDRSTALKADADGDFRVSFAELLAYTRRRSMFYLSASPAAVQTINCSCADPGFLLANRTPRSN